MLPIRKAALLVALALLVLLSAACDSGDPIDEPAPEDVDGAYLFQQFEFDPDAQALPAYSLLDTLVAAQTELRLLDGGDFVLFYQFEGGNQRVVQGEFEVRAQSVVLQVDEDDEPLLQQILLEAPVTLTRDDPARTTVLSMSRRMTVDLSRFSDLYAGIPPVAGRLQVTLVLEE